MISNYVKKNLNTNIIIEYEKTILSGNYYILLSAAAAD